MTTVFRTSRLVEFSDTDMAGIVHFSNFFRYMEAAEHAFLRSHGLSVITTWEGETVSFPRVSSGCDYSKPARFEDTLDIEVRIEHVGKTSLGYRFVFFNAGEQIAEGYITVVMCRVLPDRSLQSMEIPDALKQRFVGASS